MFLSRNTYNRLHAGGIANVATTLCVVAAIVVEKSISAGGIKALLIGLVFWIAGPIVSHVTARSEHANKQQ
jgi:multisubunit Na+/H+ antiporter MnhG subunit